MRTRSEVESLLAAALAAATADEAQVRYEGERTISTRFADNAITQNSSMESEEVTVMASFGAREGRATTNRVDAESLSEAVRRAEAIAREAPENPEHVALPPAQEYPRLLPAWHASTAESVPERLAEAVARIVGRARQDGLAASGLVEVRDGARAIANSRGLAAYDRRTRAGLSTTMHGAAGSCKAAGNRDDLDELDVAGLAEKAASGAVEAQEPADVEPGDYTVVFEPLAVSELLPFLLWTLSAREASEGSSPFAGAVGKKIASELVTLGVRLDDPELVPPPFGQAGLAVRPTTWIDRGVLRRLYHDRYWAQQTGEQPDASLWPLYMAGEDRSVDDLIRSCGSGLLVRNLWYIRFVDRRSLLLTGMTRDGLFRIEDGRVAGPVKNLRWNESPLHFLERAVALSRPERVSSEPMGMLPAVLSEAFTFTSTTDSI